MGPLKYFQKYADKLRSADKQEGYSFIIQHPKQTFELMVDTEEDRDELVSKLNAIIREAVITKSTVSVEKDAFTSIDSMVASLDEVKYPVQSPKVRNAATKPTATKPSPTDTEFASML